MDSTISGIKNKLNCPIILVGMMGCGKSRVGDSLSDALDIPLYDSDALVEQDAGISITQIFKDKGEAYFRSLETQKISALLEKGACVISTGGGAVTSPQTLDAIANKGISIWLKSDVQTIFNRVKDDQSRPLLHCENPQEKLEELLAARESLYAQADIHIDNNGESIEAVISNIGQELNARM